jgi:6-phosphogluconolactonase (cycloisomerase 2 family)
VQTAKDINKGEKGGEQRRKNLRKHPCKPKKRYKIERRTEMNKKILVAILTAAILMISVVGGWACVVGAVYTMTNAPAPAGNEVVIFNRADDGLLTKTGSISTQGTGSGVGLDTLGSQGSLVLSEDHLWLLAVNAGSNEISVFQVLPEGLKLVDKVASGGVSPVSLTIFADLVYVLNAGSPNIAGFNLSHHGHLTPLAGSTRALVSTGAFAQVGFDPRGEKLIVTDKGDSEILVFSVDYDGLPSMNPVTSPSNGVTPFGFIFDQWGHLVVVEVTTDAVSSYSILHNDTLNVISPSVTNGQKASCWIVGNELGYIFTANPGSSTISAYKIDAENGKLVLLNGTAGSGKSPLDVAIPMNGRFLYALDPGNGGIDMFQIENNGSLTGLGTVAGGLSIFAQGIAAR